jgi:hypothetical protein
MQHRAGFMSEVTELRLLEPAMAEIEAKVDWQVVRVEPMVEIVNRPLSWLFGDEDPALVLIKRNRAKAPRNAHIPASTGPLLAGARERLKPGSKSAPTVAQMKAVVMAYKRQAGAGRQQLSEVRNGMKGKAETAAAFKALLGICGTDGLPWKEMGAPEELPLSLGVAHMMSDDDESEDEGDDGARY